MRSSKIMISLALLNTMGITNFRAERMLSVLGLTNKGLEFEELALALDCYIIKVKGARIPEGCVLINLNFTSAGNSWFVSALHYITNNSTTSELFDECGELIETIEYK